MGNLCGTNKAVASGSKAAGKRRSLTSNQKNGAKELKQNYKIDNGTKVLGNGAFGKVFLTTNKHDARH